MTKNEKILGLLEKIDKGYQPTNKEVKYLEFQTGLDLRGKRITALPESVGQLTKLQ